MEKKNLELRMYFLVLYNLSAIQKGIQAGHAGFDYILRCIEKEHKAHYKVKELEDFLHNYKTWIILDGGTSNDGRYADKGDMEIIREFLEEKKIHFGWFHEPDLNLALTAICFLCDERVWDRENYPDFKHYLMDVIKVPIPDVISKTDEELQNLHSKAYKAWTESLGGMKNIHLREIISGRKLAL